MSKEPSGSLPC